MEVSVFFLVIHHLEPHPNTVPPQGMNTAGQWKIGDIFPRTINAHSVVTVPSAQLLHTLLPTRQWCRLRSLNWLRICLLIERGVLDTGELSVVDHRHGYRERDCACGYSFGGRRCTRFHCGCNGGINVGRVGDNLPGPGRIVELLQRRKVRIYDADLKMLTAFKGSGIKVTVAVPNDAVATVASSQQEADRWVRTHVKPFVSFIDRIAVGNEWLHGHKRDVSPLVLAMQNIHRSLVKLSLSKIKVTTPHAFDAIGFPPSKGRFPYPADMKRILNLLQTTKSAFTLNVYPFFAYKVNANVNREYAVFNPNSNHVIDMGRRYTNLFDAQVDTHRSAMAAIGYPDFPLVIGETGWPSAGSNARGVNIQDAQTYNNNLVKHELSSEGTPMRRNVRMPTYIFALFNENLKGGGIENNWGLYHPNMTPVYSINLSV
uniref:Glucan endo-1,3-beta-D-glucosidase n=1 Tax=Physcomitrium patens TaxID=3218 RepID=A0A7I4FCM3_PHYPA